MHERLWKMCERTTDNGRRTTDNTPRTTQTSMPEMTEAGKNQRHVVLVGGSNHFLVAHGSSRLDSRCNTGFGRLVQAVPERKKRVGSHRRTLERARPFVRC